MTASGPPAPTGPFRDDSMANTSPSIPVMAANALLTHPVFCSRKTVAGLATLCCLLWGSSYPAIKNGFALFAIEASDLSGKLLFAGWRCLLAGLALLLIAALARKNVFALSRKGLLEVSLLGLLETSLMFIFLYLGLAYTTGVKGSLVLNGSAPFFSVLLAHCIYRDDRLSRGKSLGCLLGFAGVLVVNFDPALLDFSFRLVGEGSVIISALFFAVGMIYGKRVSRQMDSNLMTGWQLAIGGAALLLVGYALGGTLATLSWKSSLILGYLVLSTAASYAIWSVLLKYNRVGRVSVFNFLVPIFGAALSAIFLGETLLEWKNLAALALVCAGIWLVNKGK
jgi:drug/metabolite transporter (DMT)-like permease